MAGRTVAPELLSLPSAIITDGLVPVPLYAVSQISLSEQYHLPTIGTSGFRALVDSSDDTMTISGLLIGDTRFVQKVALEALADASRRGSALASWTGGTFGGLIVITSMTVRIDMQVTQLSFTATAQRREALAVSISLQHVPRPSALNTLLDVGAAAAMTLTEFLT